MSELRSGAWERAGGRCEFPGCSQIRMLEMAHLKGKQMGGSRYRNVPENVAMLCQHHHDWLDGRTTGQRRFDNEQVLRAALGRHWAGRR